MSDQPYAPPKARVADPVSRSTPPVQRRAAQLSGAGLATLTVGLLSCLVMLGGPIFLARLGGPFDYEEGLVVGLAVAFTLLVGTGGVLLWRLHPLAPYALLPLALVSLPFVPVVPVVAWVLVWAAWSGPGRQVFATRTPPPPLRDSFRWFAGAALLVGVLQPVVLVGVIVLVWILER